MTRIFKGQGYTLEYFGPEEYADKVGWKTAGSAGFDLCCLDELERPSFAHEPSMVLWKLGYVYIDDYEFDWSLLTAEDREVVE